MEQLWAQWLLVPQQPVARPPAASAPACSAALQRAGCKLGGGEACTACLTRSYHALMAAKCSPWPCPGPHSSRCFTEFTGSYCRVEGTPISRHALSAGIGTMTTVGCGCQNGSGGCCDHIVSPLTDKAFAAQVCLQINHHHHHHHHHHHPSSFSKNKPCMTNISIIRTYSMRSSLQPMNYPPACHSLGCTGNCFFWNKAALARFVR